METKSEAAAEKRRKFGALDIAYIGIFTALLAVCSWITVPTVIPVTLQTFGVCAAAGFLGAKRGVMTVAAYILLGVVGMPVFSNFSSGVGQIAGPTGGYIIGFLFTALIVGAAADIFGKKIWVYAVSMVLGIATLYAFGTAWFVLVYNRAAENAVSASAALSKCVVPFIIPDLLKAAAATALCSALKKRIK